MPPRPLYHVAFLSPVEPDFKESISVSCIPHGPSDTEYHRIRYSALIRNAKNLKDAQAKVLASVDCHVNDAEFVKVWKG